MAIQTAKHLGCEVVATAGSSEKRHRANDCATTRSITNYRWQSNYSASLMGSIDVVLDMVGGDLAQFNLDALVVDGRIACIGFMRQSCQPDLIQLLMHVRP